MIKIVQEGTTKMWYFLFECVYEYSNLCGERFFVYASTEEEAWQIAKKEFRGERLEYQGKYDDFEAEMLGYDTY